MIIIINFIYSTSETTNFLIYIQTFGVNRKYCAELSVHDVLTIRSKTFLSLCISIPYNT